MQTFHSFLMSLFDFFSKIIGGDPVHILMICFNILIIVNVYSCFHWKVWVFFSLRGHQKTFLHVSSISKSCRLRQMQMIKMNPVGFEYNQYNVIQQLIKSIYIWIYRIVFEEMKS